MRVTEINFNSHTSKTELCEIGEKYGTDKSPFINYCPYNIRDGKNCHSYTPLYNILFSSYRHQKIIFGEIGIYKNASMKMWRDYFSNAILYGWDCKKEENTAECYQEDFVELAKGDNLQNTFYDYMNVNHEDSITNALEKTKCKFDILIDDANHDPWAQYRVIKCSPKYLRLGGMLIVEDLHYNYRCMIDEMKMYDTDRFYSDFIAVETEHTEKTADDRLIILIRNGVEE